MTRIARPSGVAAMPDRYGRNSIPNSKPQLAERRTRNWTKARLRSIHRAKNGNYDAYTYFHLVEELANVKAWKPFSAAEWAKWLNGKRTAFIWDAVTVGRILADLAESWNETNPGEEHQPLIRNRNWNGTFYQVTDYPAARAVIFNLLDDLVYACEKLRDAEEKGIRPARLVSPLANCASLLGGYDRERAKMG